MEGINGAQVLEHALFNLACEKFGAEFVAENWDNETTWDQNELADWMIHLAAGGKIDVKLIDCDTHWTFVSYRV